MQNTFKLESGRNESTNLLSHPVNIALKGTYGELHIDQDHQFRSKLLSHLPVQ